MAKRTNLETLPVRVRVAKGMQIEESRYEIDASYKPGANPRSISEIAKYLRENEDAQVDAILICGSAKGGFKPRRIREREEFLKAFDQGGKGVKLKEAIDYFGTDQDSTNAGSAGLIGDDYVPLMGGPFSKQLYMYDALKMFALAFQAYHHDPIARAIIHITRDFTLVRVFRVDSQN